MVLYNYYIKLSREDTRILKGIAITIMVFFHLFYQERNVALCKIWIYIGTIPLIQWLTIACNPVDFYLFLSGYGLYYTFASGKFLHPFSRIRRLFWIYWLSLFIMLSFGAFIVPERYPGSWKDLLENITGWKTTYNGEMWFLFPYALLVLTCTYIFKFIHAFGTRLCLCISLFLYLSSAAFISYMSAHGNEWLFSNMYVYQPILYQECLFPFVLGAVSCRQAYFPAKKDAHAMAIDMNVPNWSWLICLCAIVFLRCIFDTAAWNPIFAALVILCLSKIKYPSCLKNIFVFLGDHSTIIWMTHTYFCYYLFHDIIYGLKYPLLIFLVTLLCSLAVSLLVRVIDKCVLSFFSSFRNLLTHE